MTLTFDRTRYGELLAEIQPQLITSPEEEARVLQIVEQLQSLETASPEQNHILRLLLGLLDKYARERP